MRDFFTVFGACAVVFDEGKLVFFGKYSCILGESSGIWGKYSDILGANTVVFIENIVAFEANTVLS